MAALRGDISFRYLKQFILVLSVFNLPQTFVLFYSKITNMHLATSLGSEMANLLDACQRLVEVPKHTHYTHYQTHGHHMM
jgi:hypothetical protein